MVQGRALRHGSLLLLFLFLLALGLVVENPFDSDGGGYAEDAQVQRDGGVPLSLLLHSAAYWRAVPLTLNREDYPYVTEPFALENIHRTTPPQLSDVRDNRTLISDDFYEELQLWRRPGPRASRQLEALRVQVEEERRVARADAFQQRGKRPWYTKVAPKASLLSSWWPSFLSSGKSAGGTPSDSVAAQVVEVDYVADVLYYGKSSCHTPDEKNGVDALAVSGVQRKAVSLGTDAVELVPFPFVPYEQRRDAPATVTSAAPTTVLHTDAATATSPVVSRVRIDKGKLRYTVPRRLTAHPPTHGWDHFYIALNLWRNEAVLPDLTEALIVFLEDEVRPFFNLTTAVVVSIYANVSPDRTAELIESLLIPRLHAIGVRAVYATTEGACLGYVERRPFHERIEWMACIRNKALAPLYNDGMRVFPAGAATTVPASSEGLVVLFFNDIFFRPQDITSLLESRVEAQMSRELRPHGWLSPFTTSPAVSSPPPSTNDGGRGGGTTFDMACGMDFYFTFYDTWVSRDRLGNPLEAQMPYSDDHLTQEAFYRIFRHHSRRSQTREADSSPMSTAAVPVKCCWNGVAAIRGRLFLPPTPKHRAGFSAAASPPPQQQQQQEADATARNLPRQTRASGALYDLLGNVQEAVNATRLVDYYVRLLARRVQWERREWNRTRGEIAALITHPYYTPVVYANMSTFPVLLDAVMEQIAVPAAELDVILRTAAPGETPLGAQQEGAAVEPTGDDSVYYAARHPAVRFRHAFTPSYGATVNGRKPVRDDVCLSSECLLVCQDVMQAAILQDRRTPLILLNPQVRVAYDLEHFKRVMSHTWFFENPYVYRMWVLARRWQLWWSTGGARGGGALQSAEVRERGSATSALDDWLRSTEKANDESVRHGQQLTLAVEDGRGAVLDRGMVDVAKLTEMDCQRITSGDVGLAIGAFFPVIRFVQLLIVALLLRWLCWSAQADTAAKFEGSNGVGASGASWPAKALTVEEQWWHAAYSAIWLSRPALQLRSWLAADDEAETPWDELSGPCSQPQGDVREAYYMEGRGRGGRSRGSASATPPLLPGVPFLHLQLRQRYRRRKLAATLGSCAHRSRHLVRSVCRAVVWAIGTVCCVRCWCGCRTPGPPPPPDSCAETRCGALWASCAAALQKQRRAEQQQQQPQYMPRQRSLSLADVERSTRGEHRGAWSSIANVSRTAAAVTPATATSRPQSTLLYPADDGEELRGEGWSPYFARGSRESSPGRSAVSSPTTGVFRDGGEAEDAWQLHQQQQQQASPQLQQQLRRTRPSPWQLRQSLASALESPPPPSASSSAPTHPAGSPTAYAGTNPLVTPSGASITHSTGFVTSPVVRFDGVYSGGGGGGALQSVRPRNASGRPGSSHATHSPRSPDFGPQGGGRPGDGAGVTESVMSSS